MDVVAEHLPNLDKALSVIPALGAGRREGEQTTLATER